MFARHDAKGLLLTVLSGSLVLGSVSGCSDDDDDPTDPSTDMGRVQIELTDAPFPYAMVTSVDMTVGAVELHVVSDVDDSSWITIDQTAQQVNLLDLRNGNTIVVADAEVPTGEIDQIRLHIDDVSVELTDERTFDLDLPAGDQDGIQILPADDIVVASGVTTELLLDFDVSQSFTTIPATPTDPEDISDFQFQPTIQVADLSTTGAISGIVYTTLGTDLENDDLPLSSVSVSIYAGPEEVASTATSPDGTFLVQGLDPGAYTVTVSVLGFVEATRNATVEAGSQTDLVVVRLDPTEP